MACASSRAVAGSASSQRARRSHSCEMWPPGHRPFDSAPVQQAHASLSLSVADRAALARRSAGKLTTFSLQPRQTSARRRAHQRLRLALRLGLPLGHLLGQLLLLLRVQRRRRRLSRPRLRRPPLRRRRRRQGLRFALCRQPAPRRHGPRGRRVLADRSAVPPDVLPDPLLQRRDGVDLVAQLGRRAEHLVDAAHEFRLLVRAQVRQPVEQVAVVRAGLAELLADVHRGRHRGRLGERHPPEQHGAEEHTERKLLPEQKSTEQCAPLLLERQNGRGSLWLVTGASVGWASTPGTL